MFFGVAVPMCSSYIVERQHRAVFSHQLRCQLTAQSCVEDATGPSCSAPKQHTPAQDSRCGGPRIEEPSSPGSDDLRHVDGGPAPMMADVLVIGAWLPLACVCMWQAAVHLVT